VTWQRLFVKGDLRIGADVNFAILSPRGVRFDGSMFGAC
jgi:hypothetical protein